MKSTVLRNRRQRAPRVTRRAAEIGDAAAHLGLQFTSEDHLHLDRLPFTFLRGGELRQVADTAWGTVRGMSVWVFDVWLRRRMLPGGNPHLTCLATVVTAGFPRLAVVGGEASPGGRDAAELGYQPFEPPPELAERFEVWTTDPEFAAALLTPDMLGWLADGHPTERWETSGPYLMLAVPAARGDELAELLERLESFRGHLPSGLAARYPPLASSAPRRRDR